MEPLTFSSTYGSTASHEDRPLLPTSNSIYLTDKKSTSSSKSTSPIVQFNAWTWIGILLTLSLGIYYIQKTISANRPIPMAKPTPISFESGTRIQLNIEGQYLRVNKAYNSAIVIVGTTPWVSGSTFEIHSVTTIEEENFEETEVSCFFLQSIATMKYVGIDDMYQVFADRSLEDAIPLSIMAINGDLQNVQIRLCKNMVKLQHKKESKSLSDSKIENSWLAFPIGVDEHNTDFYSSSVYVTANAELSRFSINTIDRIKGVNLGGWFIPEVWMSRSVYNDTKLGYNLGWAGSLCKLVEFNRDIAEKKMIHQLETWITESDIAEMASLGVNSIRVPIGYWNIIEDPYKKYAPGDYTVARAKIDLAFEWASKYGMSVLLDLHGAPGSQNGIDHSGCSEPSTWLTSENQKLSIAAVKAMVERYAHHPALWGFELLNEPSLDLTKNNHEGN
jgi:hypothetical protein